MASNTHQYPCLDDSAAVGDWKTVNSYYINNFKEYKPSESSFKNRYILLCRWQTQVEFFLYQLCRIAAPNVVDECHWHCPEAAELSRLSEKITEYFCFHHKKAVQVSGISETEREDFCANIHGIRQVRHCAVHRVPANAITIAKYAKMVQNVLSISRRLGGTKFENAYGDLVCLKLLKTWKLSLTNVRGSWTDFLIPSGTSKDIIFHRYLYNCHLKSHDLPRVNILLVSFSRQMK